MSNVRLTRAGQRFCPCNVRRRSKRTVSSSSIPDETSPSITAQNASSLNSSSNGVGKALLPKATKVDQLQEEFDALKAKEKGIPHRWLVVSAMVAAFVLCNMDKVCLLPAKLWAQLRSPCVAPEASMLRHNHKCEMYCMVPARSLRCSGRKSCDASGQSFRTCHT